jgi:hypothetical protein
MTRIPTTPRITLRWGHFAEDRAQCIFLETVVPMLIESVLPETFEIIQDRDFTMLQAQSWKEVSRFAGEACIDAARRGLHLCVVARDVEEVNCYRQTPGQAFQAILDTLKRGIPPEVAQISVIALPVKTLEYWLWWIQLILRNDAPEPNTLEEYPQKGNPAQSQKPVKAIVYGYNRLMPSARKEADVLKQICGLLNVQILDILGKNSTSFQQFSNDLRTFTLAKQ